MIFWIVLTPKSLSLSGHSLAWYKLLKHKFHFIDLSTGNECVSKRYPSHAQQSIFSQTIFLITKSFLYRNKKKPLKQFAYSFHSLFRLSFSNYLYYIFKNITLETTNLVSIDLSWTIKCNDCVLLLLKLKIIFLQQYYGTDKLWCVL